MRYTFNLEKRINNYISFHSSGLNRGYW